MDALQFKLSGLTKRQRACKHPDAYTRSKYVGHKFMGAVYRCRDCDLGITFKTEDEVDDVARKMKAGCK